MIFNKSLGAGRHLARPIQDIHTEISNSKGFSHDSFNLPDDDNTRAYWLCNNKDAEKVLVWFHGDYCRPMLLLAAVNLSISCAQMRRNHFES